MLQKLMKKEDRAPEQAGIKVLGGKTPTPEATKSQVVMGKGVDEGHCWDAAPPSIFEAAFCLFILFLFKGNVRVTSCKFVITFGGREKMGGLSGAYTLQC